MSAGDIDDVEADASELANFRRDYPDLDEYLKWAWEQRAVRTFFIPFAAGISSDGKVPYISYDVQTIIDGIDLENALVRHETTEWGLRQFCGVGDDYGNDPIGHRIANNAEFTRVRSLMARPNALDIYKEIIDEQVYRSERTSVKGRPIPRDLALYPYGEDPILYDKLVLEMHNDRSYEEWNKLHPPETVEKLLD